LHELREKLAQADAAISEAESERALAESESKRYSRLLQDGIVSEKDFDRIATQAKTASARLAAAQKNKGALEAALQREEASSLQVDISSTEVQRLLDERDRLDAAYAVAQDDVSTAMAAVQEIQARFEDTVIRAPVRATVIEKLVEKGELAAPGTRIATLMDLNDIYVRIFVPETAVGRIRLGDPATVLADAFPSEPFEASVRKIAERAEFTPKDAHVEEERAKLVFAVEVAVKNPDGYLKPGMSVDVTVNWKAR
jgi:HlyD family secretion protein